MARTYTLTIEEQSSEAEVWEEEGRLFVRIADAVHEVSLGMINDGRLCSLLIDGNSFEVYARRTREGYDLLVGSELYQVEVARGRRAERERAQQQAPGMRALRSPMTGIVADVAVVEGQAVERGDVLVVLESMKMNNELRCEADATVVRVAVSAGQRVERGSLLLELELRTEA